MAMDYVHEIQERRQRTNWRGYREWTNRITERFVRRTFSLGGNNSTILSAGGVTPPRLGLEHRHQLAPSRRTTAD